MIGAQQEVVDYCISSGLRKFYFPEPIDGRSHQWTFLRPWETIDTIADQGHVSLGDSVAGVEGNLFFDVSENAGYRNDGIEQVSYHKIRRLRQKNQGVVETGYPKMAAVVPEYAVGSQTDGSQSHRLRIEFWPTPDDIYTIH